MSNSKTFRSFALAVACALSMTAHAVADTPKTVNVLAGNLADALETLAKQCGVDVIYPSSQLKGLTTEGVSGVLETRAAFQELLKGTRLVMKEEGGSVLITLPTKANTADARSEQTVGVMRLAQADQTDSSQSSTEGQKTENPGNKNSESPSGDSENKLEELDEIIVTGTKIRGVKPVGAPLTVYTRADMDKSGAATLAEFARLMPQNFASLDVGTSLSFQTGGFSQFATTTTLGQSAFNLHGMGPAATLTLLNGHRLASSGLDGDFVDISLIPTAAIDRIEVLSDGASALYGADAVAGVVNIVLKKQLDGAETSVSYRDTTQGGASGVTASQAFGTSWDRGSALLAYEYHKDDPLAGDERDFIPPNDGVTLLIFPPIDRHSVFLTGRQDLGPSTVLSGDVSYSRQDALTDLNQFGFVQHIDSTGENYGATFGIERRLNDDWQLNLDGVYSRTQGLSRSSFDSFTVPGELQTDSTDTRSRLMETVLRADGPLFSMPGGAARAAIGGGYRKENLASHTVIDDAGSLLSFGTDLDRNILSAYAELLFPLVGGDNRKAAVESLELSLAARYDRYSDFGSDVSPRVGLSWSPIAGLSLRGSYGNSFRAPPLTKLMFTPGFTAFDVPNPTLPGGGTTATLFNGGGNPQLDPEKSRAFTVGFDLRPAGLPGFNLATTYYNVRFEDRISTPPLPALTGVMGVYSELDLLAPFFDFSPDPAEVQAFFDAGLVFDFRADPDAPIEVIFDGRVQNIAKTEQAGLEFSAGQSFETALGTFGLTLGGHKYLNNEYQVVSTGPTTSLRHLVYQPADLRLNGGINWSRAGFSSSLTVRHWGSTRNVLFTPAVDVSAFTIADVQLSYATGERGDALGDLDVTLTVQNVTDKNPPRVTLPPSVFALFALGYDPTNSNPLGRTIGLSLRKRW